MIWIAVFLALGLLGGSALLRWGTRWGSTPEERARRMPGDEYIEGGPRAQVAMTRAISISAPPERVWPWISQLGRGAGWYSVDWLDNGRKASAWHIVPWIPEPRLGDATAIGYLRHIDAGRSVAWWIDGERFLGSCCRMVTCYDIRAEGQGTRLISRISADAAGPTAHIVLLAFRAIDSIMARRQLIGLRNRVEYCEKGRGGPRDPETGDRDQYQLYEILYATGDRAGVAGKEHGAKWRQSAIRDGVLEEGK
ncbi:MAG: SRPBCC family protein [Gemmatimonadota bacterium]|nr:MAG: SRPBCC family protein [Gemmatimonadota bacterium]